MSEMAPVQSGGRVRGVRLIEMRQVAEPERGVLSVGAYGHELPFLPQRFFLTYSVPQGTTRGDHAHRQCEQLLVCIRGVCQLRVDDGRQAGELWLDRPTLAAFIPPLVWASQRWRAPDSVLLVLASRDYEPEDYIRDYREFKTLTDRMG